MLKLKLGDTMLEDIRLSLDNNLNLTREVKARLFELIVIFNNKFPSVDLSNLNKRIKTLKIEKNDNFLNKDISMYDFRTNILYLNTKEMEELAEEIRQFLIESISKTGGHLASNLGVVELTLALHKVFDSPKDKLIWDVGHQSYVHKIITGRKDDFKTLRQLDGLSGFPKENESEHDIFDTGHSSTSISVGLGIACARDIKREDFNVVSVIGDGSITGGMALEAINHLGYLNKKMIIILNDNEIVSMITEIIPPEKPVEDLLYTYIFPFDYIPDAIQEVGCYICYEIEVPKVSTVNYFFKDVIITFRIICHQAAMKTSYGATRIDYLAHLIELLFNGNTEYGFNNLELVSSVPGHISQMHRCRTVRFATKDSNRLPDACSEEEEFDG